MVDIILIPVVAVGRSTLRPKKPGFFEKYLLSQRDIYEETRFLASTCVSPVYVNWINIFSNQPVKRSPA